MDKVAPPRTNDPYTSIASRNPPPKQNKKTLVPWLSILVLIVTHVVSSMFCLRRRFFFCVYPFDNTITHMLVVIGDFQAKHAPVYQVPGIPQVYLLCRVSTTVVRRSTIKNLFHWGKCKKAIHQCYNCHFTVQIMNTG